MVKKVCKKGWGCGSTCISTTKKCRSELGEDGKKMVESFAQYVARMRPEGGAAGAIKRGDLEDPTKMTSSQRILESAKNRPEGGASGAIKLLEQSKAENKPPSEQGIDMFLEADDEELADSEGIEDTLDYIDEFDALLGSGGEESENPTSLEDELASLREPVDISQPQPWSESVGSFEGMSLDPEVLEDEDPETRKEHVKQLKGNIGEDRSTLESMGIDANNFVAAIMDFTGSSYSVMRELDRGVEKDDPYNVNRRKEGGYDGKNQVINQFLDKAEPFNGDLYRGVNSGGGAVSTAFYDAIDSLKVGDEFEQQSYSSFSSSKDVAEGFAMGERDPIIFKIPKGKNTRGASIASYSVQPTESEVLTKKGKYKIANVIIEDGVKIIEIEEI